MNYVKSMNIYGIDFKEIPCITGDKAPTIETAGGIGSFYMNTTTGDVYKCVNVLNNIYTWEPFNGGSNAGSVYEYCGSVETVNDLPNEISNLNIGDTYNVVNGTNSEIFKTYNCSLTGYTANFNLPDAYVIIKDADNNDISNKFIPGTKIYCTIDGSNCIRTLNEFNGKEWVVPFYGDTGFDGFTISKFEIPVECNDGGNIAWTGYSWDSLGPIIDLKNYYNKDEINAKNTEKEDISNKITVNEWNTATDRTKLYTDDRYLSATVAYALHEGIRMNTEQYSNKILGDYEFDEKNAKYYSVEAAKEYIASQLENYCTKDEAGNTTSGTISGTDTTSYSTNSISLGYNTKSGSMGYKIESITSDEDKLSHTFKLSSVDGLVTSQSVSVRTTSHYVSCGEVSTVDSSASTIVLVTYKPIEFKLETDAPTEFTMENYLTVDGKPELGDTVVSFNAFSIGEDSIAQERSSVSFGRQNRTLGQYGFTANRKNSAGYASAAFGYDNKALGNYTFAANFSNKVNGMYSAAFNQSNTIDGTCSFSCGTGGVIDTDSKYSFTANFSNKMKNSYYEFICGDNNYSENGTCNFMGNANNRSTDTRYSTIFGQANELALSKLCFIAGQNNYGEDLNATTIFGFRNNAYNCEISTVLGVGNICNSSYALRRGKYCADDSKAKNTYADIVGNGTANEDGTEITRSNAYTLDWDGNAWFAGTSEVSGVIIRSSTEGSNKKFKLTIDDSGSISVTEI